MSKTELRQAAFIQRKVQVSNKSWNEAINEEVSKIKGYCTDQSNSNHRDKLTDIIAPGENIDNGRIYSEATGETLRDL